METNKEAAWKSYIDLLEKAGKRTFTEIVAEAGLKSPFESGCMETIVSGADALLAKLK